MDTDDTVNADEVVEIEAKQVKCMLIDCQFVRVKKCRLDDFEMTIPFAIEDKHENRYYVTEMAVIVFNRKEVETIFVNYFTSGILRHFLTEKSDLRRAATGFTDDFGGILNYGKKSQAYVLRVLNNVIQQYNPDELWHKSGLCEEALFEKLDTNLPIIDIEKEPYSCPKTPATYRYSCKLHYCNRNAKCGLRNAIYYVSSIGRDVNFEHIAKRFSRRRRKIEEAIC